MSDNIIELSTSTGDGTMWSPEACLRDCLYERIGKQGAFEKGTKLLVLALDDSDGEYSISWGQAGMRATEQLALIEIFKSELLKMMGY